MDDRLRTGQAQADTAGLCGRCVYMRVVTSARGSRFYLCERSFSDAGFPRYPRLPVLSCEGFAADADGSSGEN